MTEDDAAFFAAEKGIEDGVAGMWDPPFRASYAEDLSMIYEKAYWLGLAYTTVSNNFPNG